MPHYAAADDRPATVLESALQYDHTPLIVLLIALPGLSWMWIVAMSRDMHGSMTGASAWMMTPVWDVQHLSLLWAMWAVMMTAMMLPSISPMLLLYGGVARHSANDAPVTRQIYAHAAGYLVVWALFSLGATALQRLLAILLYVSSMMEVTSPAVAAALLLIAGTYQLTPLKQVCLRSCESPLVFLSRWQSGAAGAFRMGVEHGALCVGCCWALMMLLFIGGVMNLTVIAMLTALIAFEKLTPLGMRSTPISGAALIAAAVWMLLR